MADDLVARLGRVLDLRNSIPQQLGMRRNTLSIFTRTWPSGRVEDGDSEDGTALVLVPPPQIFQLALPEINASGGAYEIGDIRATGITPAYPGPPAGGYTPEQLHPTLEAGSRGAKTVYAITGPLEGDYAFVELKRDSAFRYELVLRRTNITAS